MSNELEKMYNELLDDENDNRSFQDLNDMLLGSELGEYSSYDPNDIEQFVTSKELIKTKNKLEEEFGIREPERHEVEERAHFKLYGKRREHKYTEKEMNAIRESCKYTIVHDYSENDFYHMSDKEREEIDMLSEIRVKIGSLRSSYGKVDQYIEAMRTVVQAWEMLEAKGNFVHSKEEFFQMVADKRIVSNSIIMPKLRKMDKYNFDMIVKYISNPELDPKDLMIIDPDEDNYKTFSDVFIDLDELRKDPKIDEYYFDFVDDFIIEYNEAHDKKWDSLSEEEQNNELCYITDDAAAYIREQLEADKMERLLSPDQAQYILENIDNPQDELKVGEIKRSWMKNYDRKWVSSKYKGKKKYKLVVEAVHEMLNKIQNNPKNNSDDVTKSYNITNNMFNIDKEEKDFWDDLFFDGSWASDDDTYLYDLVVTEELLKLTPPGESYSTYGERQLKFFFKALEDNGVSTVELRRRMGYSHDQLNKEENKRSKKQNAKLEAAIIQRIEKLNNDPKFKKLISKAEKELNNYNNQ